MLTGGQGQDLNRKLEGLMHQNWVFIGILLLLGFLMPAIVIILNRILGPRKGNAAKQEIYECGMEPVGGSQVQFKVQYYIYALIFLIFDVEVVFLFPWAVAYNQLEMYMILEGVLFILILGAGLAYAWRKGALEWF